MIIMKTSTTRTRSATPPTDKIFKKISSTLYNFAEHNPFRVDNIEQFCQESIQFGCKNVTAYFQGPSLPGKFQGCINLNISDYCKPKSFCVDVDYSFALYIVLIKQTWQNYSKVRQSKALKVLNV